MIYLLALIVLGILIGLCAIIYSVKVIVRHNMISFNGGLFCGQHKPLVIEKAYRAINLESSFEYTPLNVVKDIRPFDHFSTERIIRDEGHLQRVIRDHASEMGIEMAKNGLIEIVDQQNEFDPTRKRVYMRAKVYQPEN